MLKKHLFRRWLAPAALLLAAAPAWADDGYAHACITGFMGDGNVLFACQTSDGGFSGHGPVEAVGPWGVRGSSSGEYRGGSWSNSQEANLATGVMRSSLLYSAGPEDGNEYQLGNYTSMSETLSFSGSGSATFVMRLSGAFPGEPHPWYPNTMDSSLDFYSPSRRDDVLGRINLAHRDADGLADFMSGSTCGWGYGLGTVSCTVHSLDSGAIAIDLIVRVDGITDGEQLSFYSSLNVQAYAPRMGGSNFGNTARIGVILSEGLSFDSTSGAFLAEAAPVPEPGSWALMLGGLAGLLIWRRRAGR